ncbi:hypothetical protein SynNOUM97013_01720 [Synechococcus sp. NOUM97013]|nr:hypothetical protein SynNOUM97013_01720 [Synechococcus sp. NOUM97013]
MAAVLIRRLQLDQLCTYPPLPFPILESHLCDLLRKLLMNVKHQPFLICLSEEVWPPLLMSGL